MGMLFHNLYLKPASADRNRPNPLPGIINPEGTPIRLSAGSPWVRRDRPKGEERLTDLTDIWFFEGRKRDPCAVIQEGRKLLILNEKMEKSRGELLDAGEVVASDWRGLTGTLGEGSSVIVWKNGDKWFRDPR